MTTYHLILKPARDGGLDRFVFDDEAAVQQYALTLARRLALAHPTSEERVMIVDELGRVVHEQSVRAADPLAWLR